MHDYGFMAVVTVVYLPCSVPACGFIVALSPGPPAFQHFSECRLSWDGLHGDEASFMAYDYTAMVLV